MIAPCVKANNRVPSRDSMTKTFWRVLMASLRFYAFAYLIVYSLVFYDLKTVRLLIKARRHSRAQLHQDLFVMAFLQSKSDLAPRGYFVEFGATDGRHLSNSLLLEKSFGFAGILAEPAKVWHKALKMNRSVAISFDCVWSGTGEQLEFSQTERPDHSAISRYSGRDFHAGERLGAKTYLVPTISLTDLLLKHDAPAAMSFLSIDTEGSELEILRNFDFERFSFDAIACEHNWKKNRGEIHSLLVSKGYVRRFRLVSFWDDYYFLVRPSPGNVSVSAC